MSQAENRIIAYFIEGARLYLREVRLSDVDANYYRWMNDPKVTRHLESRFYPQSTEAIQEFVRSKLNDTQNVFLAIVLKDGDRHIGNIKLGPINWIHRFADIGLLIGEKDLWGKGYASEAIKLVSEYAFNKLNLHKVTAGCYDENVASASAFEKVGFSREGLRKNHFFSNGRYVDQILLGYVNPLHK